MYVYPRMARAMAISCALVVLSGCNGRVVGPGDTGGETNDPAVPPPKVCEQDALLAPESYGSKVKSLLTGEPLDDEELAALGDREQLAALIDQWLATPEAEVRLRSFLASAFQQTELDRDAFFVPLGINAANVGRFESPRTDRLDVLINQNFAESFARTAYEIAMSGRPWTEVLTTDTFMMTTAQMAYMAYTDDVVIDDEENATVRTSPDAFPQLRLVVNQADAPPLSEAIDPASPNFGTFWHPKLAELPESCAVGDAAVVDTTALVEGEWVLRPNVPSRWVFSAMLGRTPGVGRHRADCIAQQEVTAPAFDRGDFSDWRPVRIVKPTADAATRFYDLPAMRSASELRIHTDRPGFFSTPGFLGTWPTNEDNSSRVTINQILIVALGASFSGDAVTDFTPEGLDTEHAAPGTPCYGCHQTLDPMREFVRGSWTNFYGQQLAPERADMTTDFIFGGVRETGSGVNDLAAILAAHPLFARGWAQKLCYFANSAACESGPEFDRVVAAFEDSGLDFRVLVRELFSSPLVTGAECVDGVDSGTAATIARRSQFCDQLSLRLRLEDICALRTLPALRSRLQNIVADAVASLPDDGFSRAEVEPVVIADTSMFTRANREATCVAIAERAFDTAFADLEADAVLDRLVASVMNVPTADPRYAEARAILADHVQAATEAGSSEKLSLQSAFVVACMSPRAAGVGF